MAYIVYGDRSFSKPCTVLLEQYFVVKLFVDAWYRGHFTPCVYWWFFFWTYRTRKSMYRVSNEFFYIARMGACSFHWWIRFSTQRDSPLVYISREPGVRYHPSNLTEMVTFWGKKILVWVDIKLGSRTPLHITDAGSDITMCCRFQVLGSRPFEVFPSAVVPDFLFMDEKVIPYSGRIVNDFLEEQHIRVWTNAWSIRTSIL